MLETERLTLRPLDKNDTDAVFAMRRDKDVMRFIRQPQNRIETENWIALVSSRWTTENLGFCAVVEKRTNKFLGWCGIWRLEETGETEVGYAIAKNFWGKGFATEAAAKLIEYAFAVMNADEIAAVAAPENTASRRVMEKLGMRFDYTGEFYGRELVHYSIRKEDFFNAKAQRREDAVIF